MQPHFMIGSSDYVKALESERLKILVFSKELPLSLDLVTRAIEALNSEHNLKGQSECSGQTSSQGPVLEEFIPIKRREDDEDEQHSHHHHPTINNSDETKLDWLRSVQLWNIPQSPVQEDVPRKTSVLEVNRDGGAFQPFHREASVPNALTGKASSSPPSPPPPPPRPVAGSNKKEGQSRRKQRRYWSQELHKRFVDALQQLGGADFATPKQIRGLMKVDGLTNDEVKSHLQKFRLHTRRPSHLIQNNNGDSQTAQFVLVRNIIVQPPEHAPPLVIYAPVESHAPAVVPTNVQRQVLDLDHCCERSNSEERGNHSEVADHPNSPDSSSSTFHTITDSPRC
ncbi:transcription factor HHO3-like [Prosopis cineraria]|uniref:transcription factor HHO3-like n=1 Tax=Prosopis cineraria TaxID=364024 RepID=UPI00240EBDCC|nr:transcription factor HHO3-like [Prosopis cineraria]